MSAKAGFEGMPYLNTGSYGSPTWLLVGSGEDVTVDLKSKDIEAPRRKGKGHNEHLQGLHDWGLEVATLYDWSDPAYALLMNAYLTRGTVEVWMADQDVSTPSTTVRGPRFTACITEAPIDMPMGDKMGQKFSLKPSAKAANPPDWYSQVNP